MRIVAALVLAASAAAAPAQQFPTKPIRLVVPFAPGGSSSIVARSVAHEMEAKLGQPIVIDNKPGGAGNVAMQEVARAEPDGYTLIIGHIGTLAVNPYMFPSLPFDTNRDFAPVSLLAKVPNIFVVNADVPAKNLKEFAALAQSRPGQLYYASAGNGSAGHLAFEYLKLVMKIDIVHVPYKGTGPLLTELRAIAVGTPVRIAALSEVPTVAEQGYPGFETSQWYGLMAPAKTPQAIVDRLAAEAAAAVKTPMVQERFAVDSALGVGSTPQEFAEFIKQEQARWSEVVRKAGIKAD
jgi:tripartite-type tricarboxylate transporter receptor subunit TctC